MWGGAKGAITGRASQGGPGAVKGALRGAWQGIRKQDIDPTQPLLGKKKK
jgi:hypothetical protein